jgi:hypothetical protein
MSVPAGRPAPAVPPEPRAETEPQETPALAPPPQIDGSNAVDPVDPVDPVYPVGTPPSRPSWRRRLSRVALWLLALLVFASTVLLQSEFAREQLRQLVETALSQRLERPVTVGAARFSLLPPVLRLEAVTVPASEPGAPPLATLEALRLEVAILDWGSGLWSLRQVEARRPQIVLRRDADGRWDLPPLGTEGSRKTGELRLDALVIEGGRLQIEDRQLAVDGAAQGLRVRLTEDAEGRFRGQVKIDRVTVTLPGARPYEAAVLLNAELLGERLEVGDLRLQGEALDLQARGTVRWDEQPGLRSARPAGETPAEAPSQAPSPPVLLDTLSAHFQVTASGDLDLVGRLGYLGDGLVGPVQTTGSLDWSSAGWRYQGQLDSPGLALWDRPVGTARGRMEWRPSDFRLEIDDALFAQGHATGRLTVATARPEQPLEIDLRFEGLDADQALERVGLPRLHLSGLASGTLNLRSVRGQRERPSGWGSFTIEPLETGDAAALAVTGDIPLTFDHGVLSSTALFVSSERQRVLAEGEYDLVTRRGRFDFTLDTEDSGQITALIEEQLDLTETPSWLPYQGRGTATGTLILAPETTIPTWELRLDLRNAATPAVTAEHGWGSLRVHEGGVDRIQLELQTGPGALLITGESRVPPTGSAVSALVFDALDWPLGELPIWRLWGVPLDGAVSGRLRLDGPAEALEGKIDGALKPARVYGHDVGRLAGQFAWDPREARLDAVVLHTAEGTVTTSGSVALDDGTLDLQLVGTGLRLDAAPLARLAQGHLGGRLDFQGRLRGSGDAPRAQLELETRDISVLGRAIGSPADAPQRLKIALEGSRFQVDGSLLGLVAVEGRGTQTALGTPDGDLKLAADVTSDAVRGLAELALGRSLPQVDGALAGRFTVEGPWSRPEALRWSLALQRLTGRYEDHALALVEPATLGGQGGTVTAESVTLAEEATGSRLSIDGSGGATLDLQVQGEVDMAWSRLVWPEVDFPGKVTVAGRLVGSPTLPAFEGQAAVRLEPFPLLFAPQTVENLQATLLFTPEQINLDTLQAEVGGGQVQAWGQMELTPEHGLQGYRLYARANQVKLLYPEGWLQKGDAELYLTSLSEGREIRGTVDLDEVRYLAKFDLGVAQALRKLLEPERLEVGTTDELLTSTQLNIAIKAPGAVRLNNELVNLRGSLDLELQGDLALPILLGKAEVDPGGTVRYAGNDYAVERGALNFTNPYRVEPEIDLVARSRLRAYEVTLNITGTPERLDVDVASDPPLPRLDVLSLIASGRPPDRDTAPARPGTREGEYTAETFLFGEAASALTQRVNTLFGFDKFRIDPLSEGNEAVSSVRFTVGKRLSKDWFVTYSRDPSSTDGDILEAEWQVSRQLVLVFSQNGDGSFSVDALWDRQF